VGETVLFPCTLCIPWFPFLAFFPPFCAFSRQTIRAFPGVPAVCVFALKSPLQKIFGPNRSATSHWRVKRQFTKKTNRKYHITSMKTHKTIKSHFVHLFVLVGLASQIAVPGLARSQTWTQTSAPAKNWLRSLASSADGTRLVAGVYGGSIYTSTNSGGTWKATTAPTEDWFGISSSADGSKLVAAPFGTASTGVPLYVSINAGVTWTAANSPSTNWWAVACSTDGTKVVATCGPYSGVGTGLVYRSTNSGFTWTKTSAVIPNWFMIGSSADGTKLVATAFPGGLFTSTNSGTTWAQASAPTANWCGVACSADGNKWVAAAYTGSDYPSATAGIYTSTNAGITWSATSLPPDSWQYVASSADGTKLAASPFFGDPIYSSSDSGVTWTTTGSPPLDWGPLAMSADGNQLTATTGPLTPTTGNPSGSIWTFQTTPTPSLSIAPAATNAMVSWTIPSLNFTLQQNSDLTTTNWTNVALPPILNLTNLQNQVMVSAPASGQAFYRLMH